MSHSCMCFSRRLLGTGGASTSQLSKLSKLEVSNGLRILCVRMRMRVCVCVCVCVCVLVCIHTLGHEALVLFTRTHQRDCYLMVNC